MTFAAEPFSFQTTLHTNGTIYFAYKQVKFVAINFLSVLSVLWSFGYIIIDIKTFFYNGSLEGYLYTCKGNLINGCDKEFPRLIVSVNIANYHS